MDANVGRFSMRWTALASRDNTIVIFTSDNGPEYIRPWDGWAGPWRGQYFTAFEGGIRVPFMIRWPGKIAAGRESNEIVHGVDMFATLARFGGCEGADRSDRSTASTSRTSSLARRRSPRAKAFPIWCADRLQAVKWRNWKLHFYRQDTMFDPPVRNPVPTIYNLYTDPREEKPTPDSWVVGPVLKIVGEFEQSLKQHPLIPMGTPDPYRPGSVPQ
jgi:arylsulfatase A-like enzyme